MSLPHHEPRIVAPLYEPERKDKKSQAKTVDAKAATERLEALEKANIAVVKSQEKKDERKNEDLKAKIAGMKLVDAEHAAIHQVDLNSKKDAFQKATASVE